MYIVVAKDYTAYERFLAGRFYYIGDLDIENIDPDRVKRIILADGYDEHPSYFSDEFLKLQLEVAARKESPRQNRKWYQIW